MVDHEYVEAAVHPGLRRLVTAVCGYRITGAAPGVHVGMPSRSLTVIVPLDGPLRLGWDPTPPTTRPTSRPAELATVLAGLHARPAYVHHDGQQEGIQLAVTPLGARRLFGMPAGALATNAVTLGDVVGSVADRLAQECAGVADWTRRLERTQSLLVALVRDRPAIRPELSWAWACLVRTHGLVAVRELAGQVGWSPRHLTDQFRAEFGLAPKLAARVMRFDRSRRMLRGPGTLADVAARCGYADQSHLVRDWRQFAGASPTRWLATDELAAVPGEEFAFVQDIRNGRAAG